MSEAVEEALELLYEDSPEERATVFVDDPQPYAVDVHKMCTSRFE